MPRLLLESLPQLREASLRVLQAARVRRKRRALRPLERKLRAALVKAFRLQGAAVLKWLEQFRDRLPGRDETSEALREAAAMPPSDWEWRLLFQELAPELAEYFEQPLEEAIGAALKAGGADVVHSVGAHPVLRFDLKNPRAVAYLKDRAAELVRGIDDTTRDGLAQMVTKGAEVGHSYTRIAQAIRDRYAEMGSTKPQAHVRDRATLIAVTELGQGYEHGGFIVAQDLADGGLAMEKSWLTVGDVRVSDGCVANAAAGWIPIERAFPSGHDKPLRFPGCRCSALYQRARGAAGRLSSTRDVAAPAATLTDEQYGKARREHLSYWVGDSVNAKSVSLKRAAKDVFKSTAAVYNPERHRRSSEEIDTARQMLERLYQETQAELARRGITEIKLYRGIKSAIVREGVLESYTESEWVARGFGTYDVIERVVRAEDILAAQFSAGWPKGDQGEQEWLIINRARRRPKAEEQGG